jgi:ATP synthase protein I
MPEDRALPEAKLHRSARRFLDRVAAREAQMLRRKHAGPPRYWRAAALAGLIGWTVVVPMLIGIAIGRWIDRTWPSRLSWTIMLLFAGLALGCANAWNRIRQEQEDR